MFGLFFGSVKNYIGLIFSYDKYKLQFVEQLRYKTINKNKTKATYLTIKEGSGQIKSLPTNSQSFKHK